MTVGDLREKLRFFEDHALVWVDNGQGALLSPSELTFEVPVEQRSDPSRYPTNLTLVIDEDG